MIKDFPILFNLLYLHTRNRAVITEYPVYYGIDVSQKLDIIVCFTED